MKKIFNLYKVNKDLPKELVDLLNNSQNYNLKEKRILSVDEILDTNNDLQVDFVSLQLIPLIDCFDNDYICYDLENESWTMFNIVEEIKFKQTKNLVDLINYKN